MSSHGGGGVAPNVHRRPVPVQTGTDGAATPGESSASVTVDLCLRANSGALGEFEPGPSGHSGLISLSPHASWNKEA